MLNMARESFREGILSNTLRAVMRLSLYLKEKTIQGSKIGDQFPYCLLAIK